MLLLELLMINFLIIVLIDNINTTCKTLINLLKNFFLNFKRILCSTLLFNYSFILCKYNKEQ